MGYLSDQGLFGSWLFIAAIVVGLSFVVAHIVDLYMRSFGNQPTNDDNEGPEIFLAEENHVGINPTNSYIPGNHL